VYVVHLSCKEALDVALAAKQRGVNVWVETLIEYLLLDKTYAEREGFEGAKWVMSPPLREAKNHEVLWNGLRHGMISTVGTDHAPFDYKHQNANDDFIPLMEELVTYDTIVLASPVYWYAVSSYMKTFLDRWSDLLTIRKDLAQKLERKRLFLIASFAADAPLGCVSFENPIRQSCQYMNINYGGCFYDYPDDAFVRSIGFPSLEEFRSKLFSSDKSLELQLSGNLISLRLANMGDRLSLFEWMYMSDASRSMWGPPTFPEKKARTWDEFKTMWAPYYFQQPLTSRGHVFVIEKDGVGVGSLAFHCPDSKNRSELDIWMRSEKDCGQGFGSEAVDLLTRFLFRELGIAFFWMQPSARNPRSIRAYEKTKFKSLALDAEAGKKEFGFQDYHDSVYMLRDMSLG
jgi:RimJ/RimL family protein N-acetyltransferase